jgi:hypothetical protein
MDCSMVINLCKLKAMRSQRQQSLIHDIALQSERVLETS